MDHRNVLQLLTYLLVFLVLASFCRHLALEFAPAVPRHMRIVKPSLAFVSQSLVVDNPRHLPSPSPAPAAESVLFPGWDVFVLLPAGADRLRATSNHTCVFADGATSPANYAGTVPSSGRHGFICRMPRGVQRRRPFRTPRIVAGAGPASTGSGRATEMMRWNRLAYESYSTADDVIVFAKGINRNQGRDRPAEDVSCVFTVRGAVVAATNSTSSAQEVFRCPHPPSALLRSTGDDVRVSVRVAGEETPIPSLAAYRRRPVHGGGGGRRLTCACTMVYNAGKFMREWVEYHAAIGVERFVVYDNGSDDGLAEVVAGLGAEGHDVGRVYWPWQKTQEAGFSHCAASQGGACEWAAFLDVDEFLYSPSWSGAAAPSKGMVAGAVLTTGEGPPVGQVEVRCVDFGPSGRRAHPAEGVTQGYTCRAREEGRTRRHKSVVRLAAVAHGLRNSVHHFELGPGWRTRRAGKGAVVNHYKYQAWSEFKLKFRRRVSAYVADWTDRTNPGSKDRTPGLGFTDREEPSWWASGACHVRDAGLRDLVRRWFAGPTGRFAWEPTSSS